jgi:GGDEF domain-containing protein
VTLLNKRKDGTPFWNEVFLSPVFDDEGQLVEYIGVQNDVTDTRVAQDQAEYLAFHDSLTGLANRALLNRVLKRAATAPARRERQVALVFLDLDGFKEINDARGHAPATSCCAASRCACRPSCASGDLLARLGGDEFALVLATSSRSAPPPTRSPRREDPHALAEPIDGRRRAGLHPLLGRREPARPRRRQRRPAAAPRRRRDVPRQARGRRRRAPVPRHGNRPAAVPPSPTSRRSTPRTSRRARRRSTRVLPTADRRSSSSRSSTSTTASRRL